MKKIIIHIILCTLIINIAIAANYWVADPNNCPSSDGVNFPGQNCAPEDICGDSSGTAQCYDTSTMTAPGGTATSNTDRDSGSCEDTTCNGGYITNCYATADGGDPQCDNTGSYWCDRNSTCYTTQLRDTTCTAGVFAASTCGDCRSDYLNCDTDNVDCEEDPGSTCDNNAKLNATCRVEGSGGYAWCICDANDFDCDNSDYDGLNYTGNHTGAGNGCEVTIGVTACATGSNNNQDSCSSCVCDSGYYDCDGGWNQDCDTQNGGSCTVGIVSGTYSCSVGAGGCYAEDGGTEYSCTCVVSNVTYGNSSTEYSWSGSLPFLWFRLYSDSVMFNFTMNNNISLLLNNTGLFWNNSDLTQGGADTTCNDVLCDLSDDTGYDFVDLDFTGTTGLDDGVDNDTIITNCSVSSSCSEVVYNNTNTSLDILYLNNRIDFGDYNITNDGKFQLATGGFQYRCRTDSNNCVRLRDAAGNNLWRLDTTNSVNYFANKFTLTNLAGSAARLNIEDKTTEVEIGTGVPLTIIPTTKFDITFGSTEVLNITINDVSVDVALNVSDNINSTGNVTASGVVTNVWYTSNNSIAMCISEAGAAMNITLGSC